ncbi:MAG: phosphoribosylaminoimidazolesuccinocarboxamide synthase, partial [Chloroflexota bacterium]|nr:phosphoribosylaminoimidazolesuccinocarboxamide synthase [Chloroflexota bacterium]
MEIIAETNLPNQIHRGKVRDTYDIGSGLLLMVATDRISAFDVVLPTAIPEKGVVLSHISAFWFARTESILPNHFVCMATDKAAFGSISLPDISEEVARRSTVVKRAERLDVECIARGYITGSAWAEYTKSGTVHEIKMPPGLKEGDQFPEPLFTPTTKAEEGHDMPMSLKELGDMVGTDMAKRLGEKTIEIYATSDAYARSKGIIIADTKLEFGMVNDELTVIDELLTPDSSRFWDAEGYAPGKSQPNYDK